MLSLVFLFYEGTLIYEGYIQYVPVVAIQYIQVVAYSVLQDLVAVRYDSIRFDSEATKRSLSRTIHITTHRATIGFRTSDILEMAKYFKAPR